MPYRETKSYQIQTGDSNSSHRKLPVLSYYLMPQYLDDRKLCPINQQSVNPMNEHALWFPYLQTIFLQLQEEAIQKDNPSKIQNNPTFYETSKGYYFCQPTSSIENGMQLLIGWMINNLQYRNFLWIKYASSKEILHWMKTRSLLEMVPISESPPIPTTPLDLKVYHY